MIGPIFGNDDELILPPIEEAKRQLESKVTKKDDFVKDKWW